MALRSLFPLLLLIVLNCGLQATAAEEPEAPKPAVETATEAPKAAADTPAETPPPVETKKAESPTWPNFEKAFHAGVSSYQAHKYDEARLAFGQALEKDPNNVQALTNLALTRFQLGQKGWAVALLRKAHNLEPDFSTPQSALQFILPQLDVKEIPHEIQLWETTRTSFLVPFSLSGFLGITALTLCAAGWLFLTYIGRRREALREEKPLPAFPLIPTLIALVFIMSLGLTLLKIWDQEIPRATVVADKVSVYSAPDEKSVALFDLYAGLEVVVSSVNQDWVQVTYPGALTGWVPKKDVFQTSGRNQW